MSLLAEFQTKDGGLTLDPSSKKILITLPKPNNEGNHNGGNLAFGPDGFLYAGIGDGGGGNDSTHGPIGNAQNPNTLFGKMLRIQITAASGSYGIPPDNPNATGSNAAARWCCARIWMQPSPCFRARLPSIRIQSSFVMRLRVHFGRRNKSSAQNPNCARCSQSIRTTSARPFCSRACSRNRAA